MKKKVERTQSVLVFSRNSKVKGLIKSVCQQRAIVTHEAKTKTDLIQYNYKILFVDRQLLLDDLVGILNEQAEIKRPGEWFVIILGGSPEYVPAPLRLYCRGLNKIEEASVSRIMENLMPAQGNIVKGKIKEEIFKKRVHRIVYLYHLINTSIALDRAVLCDTFGITERTLWRDLKVIRELFPEQKIYFETEAI